MENRPSFTIPGELTDLNTYIDALNSNRYAANSIKKAETQLAFAKSFRLRDIPLHYPVVVHFHWYSKDNRKDVDNVAFAKKYVLDGMVQARVLKNDSRKFVAGFSDKFFIDKINPRVEVFIEESYPQE